MKIQRLQIKSNPILGDMDFDFTINGKIIDTIIFAGENGCGKSTILECLSINNNISNFSEGEYRRYIIELDPASTKKINSMWGQTFDSPEYQNILMADIQMKRIENNVSADISYYLDYEMTKKSSIPPFFLESSIIHLSPEINFSPKNISSVTAKTTDTYSGGIVRSSSDLATEITQLIIDIDNQDNADFSKRYSVEKRADFSINEIKPRISRFNNAFSKIFDDIYIDQIENENGHKVIYFRNNNKKVKISKLSSGEKQIVFRGGYLLKDKNSLNGAIVTIDEPELSLHPNWQKKILQFYQSIFTNESGIQTSQLFLATHSPYIIHSKSRKNDKIFVLQKSSSGSIKIMEKPEYYSEGSIEVVSDAFNDNFFNVEDVPTVYLEGRTDEKYFLKAIEVFEIRSPYKYRWIGYIDENNKERNTGKDSLNNAFEFLASQNSGAKNVCLFDCDTQRQTMRKNNTVSLAIKQYPIKKGMNKGIENALILDSVDLSPFYQETTKIGDYGKTTTICELDKMKLCEHICSLEEEKVKIILANLKEIIESVDKVLE